MSESNSLDQSVASVNSKDASNTAISTSKDATNNTKTVARFTVEPGLADYGAVEGEKIEGISTNVEGDAALAWEEEEVDDDVHTALINEMCGSENQMAPTLRYV
ncbi:hypothetical protein SARC_11552 [Sphaeroforma arctica JP610]|uniref:Uncharacterized protein n=1 Tax=Sphaeroforma arctica JP610 TaxID=667725 RepID=A0A0L0FGM7_9EUKA|nr:hypothetical protein SARC_11552 [Sphaeroforma arctica JP610]KNC75932.1 hypothetical protein SARC_11552 [Sphaeroforma arctica JP610]|eukprot:XP_014149834.1 hypothetical protein SARC_11552 [Sphaeroforma arctica JP610]